MKVADLMNRIRLHEIALPEFQREYVWEVEQAQQLLQSLYRAYPTGSLLFWETTTPPATKRAQEAPQVAGQQQIILDGQQRLTTLYLLTQGEPPPYYDLHDIEHDPRGLTFDLVAGTFRSPLGGGARPPACVSVPECFRGEPDMVAIARAITGVQQGEALSNLIAQCVNNLSRLRGILDYDYPIQIVPVSASLDDAIDVFDRVNSSGTKLTPAELALTHISGKWPEARQTMKDLLHQLAEHHFRLDLDMLVRGLAGVVSGRADFAELHYLPARMIQQGWERLATALKTLIPSILTPAFIRSDTYLSSPELLTPLAVYLARNGGAFPSDQARRRAIYWLYAANMWGRYTSEVEQRLAYDLSIVRRSADPWGELVGAIVEQRGRIDVYPSDLEGRGLENSLFRMVLITLAARGATDWATGMALSTVPQPRSHQLFPLQSQTSAYDEQLQRKHAEEIANQVLLVSEPAAPLLHLLSELALSQPKLLEQHCIPTDPSLWQVQQLNAFLKARRERIAAAINRRMDSFKEVLSSTKPVRDIHEFINAGESSSLEFKATLRYNTKDEVKDLELEQEVLKAIAAFLNAEGGYLLIGIKDDASIYGIERDLEHVKSNNFDGFELELRNLIRNNMGAETNLYIHTYFPMVDGKRICVVRVFRSPRPVFCMYKPPKTKSGKSPEAAITFFVRIGNQTPKLSTAEMNSYIAMHWRA